MDDVEVCLHDGHVTFLFTMTVVDDQTIELNSTFKESLDKNLAFFKSHINPIVDELLQRQEIKSILMGEQCGRHFFVEKSYLDRYHLDSCVEQKSYVEKSFESDEKLSEGHGIEDEQSPCFQDNVFGEKEIEKSLSKALNKRAEKVKANILPHKLSNKQKTLKEKENEFLKQSKSKQGVVKLEQPKNLFDEDATELARAGIFRSRKLVYRLWQFFLCISIL